MRKFRIGLVAVGMAMLVGGTASAGELVPGGWLTRRFIPPAPPPVRPIPAEPQRASEQPRPRSTAAHRRPPAPRRHEAAPRPANDGKVRF